MFQDANFLPGCVGEHAEEPSEFSRMDGTGKRRMNAAGTAFLTLLLTLLLSGCGGQGLPDATSAPPRPAPVAPTVEPVPPTAPVLAQIDANNQRNTDDR